MSIWCLLLKGLGCNRSLHMFLSLHALNYCSPAIYSSSLSYHFTGGCSLPPTTTYHYSYTSLPFSVPSNSLFNLSINTAQPTLGLPYFLSQNFSFRPKTPTLPHTTFSNSFLSINLHLSTWLPISTLLMQLALSSTYETETTKNYYLVIIPLLTYCLNKTLKINFSLSKNYKN